MEARISGDGLPVVTCTLKAGETVITENDGGTNDESTVSE